MLAARVLLADEIAAVLLDLKRRCKRSLQNRRNRIVFRLSCCCGLRCCEIEGLNLGDLFTEGPRPLIHIRKGVTKGSVRMTRDVPLWWDADTLADLQAWKAYRIECGATDADPFVCTVTQGHCGNRLGRRNLFFLWRTAIATLGGERVRQLSIHTGRHSFISHALDAGIPLAVVMDAVGHRNAKTTTGYMHKLPREHLTDLFGQRLHGESPCPSPAPSSSTTTKASSISRTGPTTGCFGT